MSQRREIEQKIAYIKDICNTSIEYDKRIERADSWTARHWLAQTILNILEDDSHDRRRMATMPSKTLPGVDSV